MNADLQENKLRQQKAEQQKNELISNVSHDLRSPLTSIMGYVQLLKGYSDRNDEKFSEYIEVTDRRLKGLNGLINELFELTKMDSPDFRLNTEQGDVTAFIKQFGYEMQALLHQNSLNLETRIDDEPFITKVDFDRLARVMENLFANVIKYAEPHTDVRRESKVGSDSVSISLSNTIRKGAEVSTEDMFDRFYRDDHSRTDTDSAGLGLAIAKKIVELHGGEISAKADNKVITVTVVLMK
jgi:signal transduction histidine kinase